MADSYFYTIFFDTLTLTGRNARALLKLNTFTSEPNIFSLDQNQQRVLRSGKGPATGATLTSIEQAVSEISICQAVHDIAKKKVYLDSLKGTTIPVPASINLDGTDKPSRIAKFLEVGAIAVGVIATIWDFVGQNPPETVTTIQMLKDKLKSKGYTISNDVFAGWVFPDGTGVNGIHRNLLTAMDIIDTSEYTAFQKAYVTFNLVRKANSLSYEVGSFTNSNVINALKIQINNDYTLGLIKSADRMMIENTFTNKVYSPTIKELLSDGITTTLTRPMRDSGVYQ